MMTFEQQLFLLISGPAGKTPWLDGLARLLVTDYFVPVGLSLALLGSWFAGRTAQDRRRRQQAVLAVPLALLLVNAVIALSNAGQIGAERHRPYQDFPEAGATADLLFYRPPDPSFPSNSAAVAFTLAGLLWRGSRKVGLAAGAVALGLGLARVYAGVHYPLDVAVGMALGLLGSEAAWRALALLEPGPAKLLRLAQRLYLA